MRPLNEGHSQGHTPSWWQREGQVPGDWCSVLDSLCHTTLCPSLHESTCKGRLHGRERMWPGPWGLDGVWVGFESSGFPNWTVNSLRQVLVSSTFCPISELLVWGWHKGTIGELHEAGFATSSLEIWFLVLGYLLKHFTLKRNSAYVSFLLPSLLPMDDTLRECA